MTEERTETIDDSAIATRRGFPVWSYNPSVGDVRLKRKEKAIRLEHGRDVLLINPQTSEVLGEGVAGFFRREVVDDEKFVKVFIGQLDKMFDLTKTGQRILKVVWDQVQENKDRDKVELKPLHPSVAKLGVSERVFQKGVRELLEKKFIFMSPVDGVYYINMGIFFNGNRIIAATEYIRAGTPESRALTHEKTV